MKHELTAEQSSTIFDRDFLISVLSRNLAIQPYQDVCKASLMCWHALSEKYQYAIKHAYAHIESDVTEPEYAPWNQELRRFQQEPENLFLFDPDGKPQSPALAMDKALNQVAHSYIINKKARECTKLSLWGWKNSMVGFYYVVRTDTSEILRLLAMLGKYHSDPYEYRLTKLLWLAVNLLDDPSDNPFLTDLIKVFSLESIAGYDGDTIKAPQTDWSFVYLMRSNTGHYKIGFSQDPHKRAVEITKTPTILPIEIEVLHGFRCEDAPLAESALHKLYKFRRQKGEWFNLTEAEAKRIIDIKHFDCTAGFVPINAFWPI